MWAEPLVSSRLLEYELWTIGDEDRFPARAKRTYPKVLRYEPPIERQLHRAITELEKLQAARRRTSSPASGPTQAA
jgi:hypothetical protein